MDSGEPAQRRSRTAASGFRLAWPLARMRRGIAQPAENLIRVRGRIVRVGKHTDLRIVAVEPKQAIGDVVDLERVLICTSPSGQRSVRRLYRSPPPGRVHRSARATDDPSIGVAVESMTESEKSPPQTGRFSQNVAVPTGPTRTLPNLS